MGLIPGRGTKIPHATHSVPKNKQKNPKNKLQRNSSLVEMIVPPCRKNKMLFTIAKTWKQLKRLSTDDWIRRCGMCVCICIYTHNGILLSHKKRNEILPFAATWMDLENIMLSEISQRTTNTIWYHLESKKWYKWIYIQNRNRLTDIENKFVVNKREREEGYGINRYKLTDTN